MAVPITSDLQVLIAEPNEIFRVGLLSIFNQLQGVEIRKIAADIEELEALDPDGRAHVLITTVGSTSTASLLRVLERFKRNGTDLKIVCFSTQPSMSELNQLTAIGVSAYCSRDIREGLFSMVIETVRRGGLWVCPSVMDAVSHMVSNNSGPSIENLSDREQEVLNLLSIGMPNAQIARKLGISQETVKTHVRHILTKLSVPGRAEAALKAQQLGMTAVRSKISS